MGWSSYIEMVETVDSSWTSSNTNRQLHHKTPIILLKSYTYLCKNKSPSLSLYLLPKTQPGKKFIHHTRNRGIGAIHSMFRGSTCSLPVTTPNLRLHNKYNEQSGYSTTLKSTELLCKKEMKDVCRKKAWNIVTLWNFILHCHQCIQCLRKNCNRLAEKRMLISKCK